MFYISLVWIILITFELSENCSAVKINQLIIPEVINASTPTVLDCDYTLDDSSEENLVVKWYFNDNILVYQWIVGHQPISFGVLKKRVDLNYTVNSNPNQLHRALRIMNPTPELTGNYTCAVSSLRSDDSQRKQMIVLGSSGGGSSVKITQLIVPEIVTANTPTILDCDYTIDDPSEENLVVKWFFNDNILVYQWIVGRQPISIGILRKRVDLNHTVNSNQNQLYRALRIMNPTPELTGNYTCVVSSPRSEDSQKKQMIVLVPPSSFDLELVLIESRNYEIRCIAKGVFPIPNITIRLGERLLNDTTVIVMPNNNAFDVTAKSTIYIDKEEKDFSCQLNIPQTTYSVTRKRILSTIESVSTAYKHSSSLLLVLIHIKMILIPFYL
ncbi:uncharacterized protein LOC130446363 isoform X1 [Diorhabda sublineata]|uniref:uncharacterized protein LOC130446363 isoform X1 n=1 Tax=Diorhabda sublineata TaxID=1163346 RepID=UPI0024E17768|nr:uncharacterized protein LOC130446363 isoform X1 [Diorhabda sublineata]